MRSERFSVFRRAVLAVFVPLMASAVEAGPSGSSSILLSCSESATVSRDSLCDIMIKALAEVEIDRVVIQVARGEETPRRFGDIGIALFVEEMRSDQLSGHLEWRTSEGQIHASPVLNLDVIGSKLQPESYAIFVRDLIKINPELQTVLRLNTKP